MENHIRWGLGFIVTGLILEILLPFILVIDTALVILGIALILFGGRKKKLKGVKE